MDLVTWVATYIIVWWILFFMVLPWGNHTPKTIPVGFERGAPEAPRLLLKVGITSLLTIILCFLIHLALTQGWVNFKEW